MESIYSVIQENPGFYAWVFALINALWIAFTYVNRRRHERELEALKDSLKLESDRRLKVFELKVSQYEAYVANLDSFGKKHQVDLPQRMQPIFNKYLKDYLDASESGDKQKEAEVITWFNSQIGAIMNEAGEDYYRIQAESNRLKLTATDAMVEEFERLGALVKQSMDESSEFVGGFTQMVLSNDFRLAEEFNRRAKEQGEEIKESAKKLLNLMRAELREI